MAELKSKQNQLEEATILYEQILARDPAHFRSLKAMSHVYRDRGMYSVAADMIIRALEQRPRDVDLPEALVDIMAMLERRDEAIEILQGHLASYPDLIIVRNALARNLMAKGLWGEAVAVLRQGVALTPENYELVNNLSFLLTTCPDESHRSPIEAAVLMEEVNLRTGYEDPRYLHTMSAVYAARLRVDEAIAVAEKAHRIAMTSDDPVFASLAPAIGRSLDRYRELKEMGVTPTSVMQAMMSQEERRRATEAAAESAGEGEEADEQ
jgi:tetratricopeptide (TPR) repeat protein